MVRHDNIAEQSEMILPANFGKDVQENLYRFACCQKLMMVITAKGDKARGVEVVIVMQSWHVINIAHLFSQGNHMLFILSRLKGGPPFMYDLEADSTEKM